MSMLDLYLCELKAARKSLWGAYNRKPRCGLAMDGQNVSRRQKTRHKRIMEERSKVNKIEAKIEREARKEGMTFVNGCFEKLEYKPEPYRRIPVSIPSVVSPEKPNG